MACGLLTLAVVKSSNYMHNLQAIIKSLSTLFAIAMAGVIVYYLIDLAHKEGLTGVTIQREK